MRLEQQLSERLSKKGFHGFTRHVGTGLVFFFGPDEYEKQYVVDDDIDKDRLTLTLNAHPIGEFENADDLADFLLV